jgi:hypothetical protein
MSLVAELLDSIRSKRQEKFSSVAAEYESYLNKLAAGKQVDVETLADLLDQLDKSDQEPVAKTVS